MAKIQSQLEKRIEYIQGNVEKWKPSCIAEGNVKLCSHAEKQVSKFFSSNHAISMLPKNCALEYLSQRNQDLCSHKINL